MKKSLVIIGFAFIFLLSISIISAGFFDWLNGGAVRSFEPASQDLGIGDTTSLGDLDVEIIDINNGVTTIQATDSSGGSKTFSLAEGQTGFYGATQISVNDLGKGGFLGLVGEQIATVQLTPKDAGLNGGSSCDSLEIEEVVLSLGDVGENGGILNNRFIDFDEDGYLIVDEVYAYPLDEGGSYLVPIPNQECHWEASYEGGELYMVTVCDTGEVIA